MSYTRPGFTFLELLLVVGILTILAGISILLINPSDPMPRKRDEQRRNHVNDILNSVYWYANDKGELPEGIPVGTAGEICQYTLPCDNVKNPVHLDALVDFYLKRIPLDPLEPNDDGTGYMIVQDENGNVRVYAPNAETEDIEALRQ